MNDFYYLILGLHFLALLDITKHFWEQGQDKYQSLAIWYKVFSFFLWFQCLLPLIIPG